MMGFISRHVSRLSRRPRRVSLAVDALEARVVLSSTGDNLYYHTLLAPDVHRMRNPGVRFAHPYGTPARQLSFLDNDGKILTGKDRQGDEWQITVHGPGSVIVTDISPNDGYLSDDIDTIQIVGADPHKTFVNAQVVASARVLSDGVIFFNRLISENGVHTISLNGFSLTRTTEPMPEMVANAGPEIYLPGGVGFLQFHDIEANIDVATDDDPFEVVIGRPNSPLERAPRIQIDSIFNTVFDSTVLINPNGTAPTEPTVKIEVNGDIHGLEMVSATQRPFMGGEQYQFPVVGTTGRTSIRATGIDRMKAVGSLRNTTVSRSAVPFSGPLSGLRRLGQLKVGGVTDALGVDVSRGRIGGVALARGLGDPTGALPGDVNLGMPAPQFGNPAFGNYGGLIVGQSIGHFKAGPARYEFYTTMDPDYVQERTTNWTRYFTRPGRAMTNAVVMVDGSSGPVDVAGDAQGSEYKTGANYASYVNGLDPTRAPSRISRVRWKGNLVDSVVSATYRPGADNQYGGNPQKPDSGDDVAGPGSIRGKLVHGSILHNGGKTILGNTGAGFFARRKLGYLPPPQAPNRIHTVNLGF